MDISKTSIEGVLLITPKRHVDTRGAFIETYSAAAFAAAGLDLSFVQDNCAWSKRAGTVRGLHFQKPPFAQAKLVRVLKGAILDVAVDLRRSSATLGAHVAVKLSADADQQLLIPRGFAHGYVTLAPGAEVAYKVDNPYAPQSERGINWRDRDLAIAWPVSEAEAVMSEKDARLGSFSDLLQAGDLFP